MQPAKIWYLQWEHAGSTFSCLPLPKCGLSSQLQAVANKLGDFPDTAIRRHRARFGRWKNRFLQRRRQTEDVAWRFVLLRHPVERAISCWWDKSQTHANRGQRQTRKYLQWLWGDYGGRFYPDMSLAAFVAALEQIPPTTAEEHLRPYSAIIQREGSPDFLGRLGRQADWDCIRQITGLGPLPRENVRRTRPDVAKVDPALRERLAAYYAADMELWETTQS